MESVDEEINQPPAQRIALAARGFAFVEDEVESGKFLKEFILTLSWVYQIPQSGRAFRNNCAGCHVLMGMRIRECRQ